MLHQVMLGVIDFAELVRPHGINCFTHKDCKVGEEKLHKIVRKVMNGPLKNATEIEEDYMIASSRTPNFVFTVSCEIYGHVLLLLKRNISRKQY